MLNVVKGPSGTVLLSMKETRLVVKFTQPVRSSTGIHSRFY